MRDYRLHAASSIDTLPPHTNAVGTTYTGDSGDNTQAGTADDDTFNYGQGGNDTLSGGDGNDVFNMGGALTVNDKIDGGTGDDTVVIDGTSAFIDFNATTVTNVETVRILGGGGEYEIYSDDAAVAAHETMTFDTTDFTKTDGIYVNASSETDGNIVYDGGRGGDLFSSGGGDNTFYGGGGSDQVDFIGPELDDHDLADGGAGNDTLTLIFPNGGDVTLGTNVTNFETLYIYPGFTDPFSITTNDATVAKGHTLTVDMYDHDRPLVFDGGAETDGHFTVYGGTKGDVLTGGAKSDLLELGSGRDTAYGGGGNDTITTASYVDRHGNEQLGLDEKDHIDGGAGNDTLIFNVPAGYFDVTLHAHTIKSVEKIVVTGDSLIGPTNFGMTILDANVDPGKTLTIDASALGAIGDPISFYLSSNQTDSHIVAIGASGHNFLAGGALSDTLTGAGGDDTLEGLGGADTLTGGVGNDIFYYQAVSNSQGTRHDTVVGFDATDDTFQLTSAVSHVDADITAGTLRAAHFASDLGVALTGLAGEHAVLFTPDTGDDAGKTYLIVNDGVAGYQAGNDYVIELDGGSHLGSLDAGNFTLSL